MSKPMFYPMSKNSPSFAGTTLILPIVSVGNIAQLAVDLLITTLSLKRVGILDGDDLVPVVGAREDGEAGITTPLEIYGKPDGQFFIIQQRSPVIKSRKENFVRDLLDFVKTSRFAAVLVLSGVDVSIRSDSQMMTPIFHYVPPHTLAENLNRTALSTVSKLLPPYSPGIQPNFDSLESRSRSIDRPRGSEVPLIPGGGIARRILSSPDSQTPTAALLQFVTEGDNRLDAHGMAGVVGKVLGLSVKEWKEPESWKYGLFGSPHDGSLFQ